MAILEFGLKEKILAAVRLALRGIAVVANQLFTRLDADELRLVDLLLFCALKKPKLVDLGEVGVVGERSTIPRPPFIVPRINRVVVPTTPIFKLPALVSANKNAPLLRFN